MASFIAPNKRPRASPPTGPRFAIALHAKPGWAPITTWLADTASEAGVHAKIPSTVGMPGKAWRFMPTLDWSPAAAHEAAVGEIMGDDCKNAFNKLVRRRHMPSLQAEGQSIDFGDAKSLFMLRAIPDGDRVLSAEANAWVDAFMTRTQDETLDAADIRGLHRLARLGAYCMP